MPRLSHRPARAAGQTLSRVAPSRVPTTRRQPPPINRKPLRSSDLGLGPLFVHSRDAVVVGNVASGRIALWNPAAERLFGWTAEQAIGKPIDLIIPAAIVRLHQLGAMLDRVTGQRIERYGVEASDVGLTASEPDAVAGGTPDENAAAIRAIFAGKAGPHRDVAVLNAGAAIYACGRAGTLEAGVRAAEATIDDGAAAAALERFVARTGELAPA